MIIKTKEDFLKHIEYGAYAFPGGYPRYFITDDGDCLSFKAAFDNQERIAEAIETNDRTGWRVEACDVNWENLIYCCHTGKRIESAYNEDAFNNE
jgi:hypothetical protein